MKITSIQQQAKNQNRYSIFVDGEYSFSLTDNDLLDAKISKGDEISSQQIDRLKKISDDSKLLSRAIEKCLRRPHSIKEIKDYLLKKEANTDQIEAILQKCIKLKLLDDSDFAEKWYSHRKASGKSNSYIRSELIVNKGVDSSIVDRVIKFDDNQAIIQLINKKSKKYSDQNKLIEYLLRQGFKYDDIRSALSDWTE